MLLLAVAVAGASAPRRPEKSASTAGKAIVPLRAPAVVLYDQNNNDGGTGTSSQMFPDFPTFTDDLADDFVVPAATTWSINSVTVTGVYFNGPGPATQVNVIFRNNAAGIPGTTACNYVNLAPGGSGANFVLTLAPACVLGTGTYWVEVQPNMAFAGTGQWGWEDRLVQSGLGAQWQNPGGGFAVCPTWGPRTTCVGDPAAPDQMFALSGSVVPVELQTFTVQ